MNTPVALTLFNSPEAVGKVFARIRDAKPPRLFLIADKGRTPQEDALVEESKRIAEAVDWPCEVIKDYATENMGAKRRLSSGITSVFEQTDRAIILEHDCLPDPTFFTFCEELLERYKDNECVMHIGGTHFGPRRSGSYYFSRVPRIWGFATWARHWRHYDPDMREWPKAEASGLLRRTFIDPAVVERFEHRFGQYYRGEAQSWDGQWAFACLAHGGLSIAPSINLVSNIGFGEQALTTKDTSNPLANVPTEPMRFPLEHPVAVEVDEEADAYTYKYVFDVNRTMGQMVRWFFRSRFPDLYKALKSLVKTSS